MPPYIFKPTDSTSQEQILNKCASSLHKNKLVSFPTETVYGLGGNAFSDSAILKIFSIKSRPPDNPLIVHVSSIDHLEKIMNRKLTGVYLKLAQKFWPGPLSIIISDTSKSNSAFSLSKYTTSNLNSAAFRIPSNKLARDLISKSNLPIAAPSANLSGSPSPTTANHVLLDFKNKSALDYIIDGGSCEIGIESTVIKIDSSKNVIILRPGAITLEMLAREVGSNKVSYKTKLMLKEIPISPGMKYKHYSPKTKLILIKGSSQFFYKNLLEKYELKSFDKKLGILCTKELYNNELLKTLVKRENIKVEIMGSINKLETVAKKLYWCLRRMDEFGLDSIYCEYIDDNKIGVAIKDRLEKAACFDIIKE